MESQPTPTFSIVIPARDEARYLPSCLAAIERALTRAGQDAEIIVVLNRCTDETESIAQAAGCRMVKNDERNLAAIRNAGAAAARGEFIVTVDADSRVSENFFLKVHRTMLDGRFIGGGVLIRPERYSLGILATGLCLTPIALFHGISAGSFFCRTADFHAIGGFDSERASAEDIDFAIRLKRFGRGRGLKFKNLLSAHIVTSCRKFDRFGDWYLIRNVWAFHQLLRGTNQQLADKLWYKTPRD